MKQILIEKKFKPSKYCPVLSEEPLCIIKQSKYLNYRYRIEFEIEVYELDEDELNGTEMYVYDNLEDFIFHSELKMDYVYIGDGANFIGFCRVISKEIIKD